MRNIKINNSNIKALYSISKYTNSIDKEASTIDSMYINPPTTDFIEYELILNGNFTSQIKILSSISLNLKDKFTTTSAITLYNPNNKTINFKVYGDLTNLYNNININVLSASSIGAKIGCQNSTSYLVDLSLTSMQKNLKFNIIDFQPQTQNTSCVLPLNVNTPIKGNVTLGTSVESMDLIKSNGINLTINYGCIINKINNLSKYSLRDLSINKDFLDKMVSSVNFKLPITSLLYNLVINKGVGDVKVDKTYLSSNVMISAMEENDKEKYIPINL